MDASVQDPQMVARVKTLLGDDGGRLSPHWEGPTHEFGRRIIEKIIAP